VGEAALLFTLTRRPLAGTITPASGRLPFVVYVGISFYACVGGAGIVWAIMGVRRWRERVSELHFPAPRLQLSLWLALVLSGVVVALCFSAAIGVLLLLLAQPLPRTQV
jgi:hypothetical protein